MHHGEGGRASRAARAGAGRGSRLAPPGRTAASARSGVSRLRVAYVAHSVDPARGGMELVSARLLERLAERASTSRSSPATGSGTLPAACAAPASRSPIATERRAPRALRPARDGPAAARCGAATTSCTAAARSPTRAIDLMTMHLSHAAVDRGPGRDAAPGRTRAPRRASAAGAVGARRASSAGPCARGGPPSSLRCRAPRRKDLAARYPTLPVSVVENGVDLTRFADATRTGAQPDGAPLRVVVVAGDFERKGVPLAIRAVARTTDCHLRVVGDGDRRVDAARDRRRLRGARPHRGPAPRADVEPGVRRRRRRALVLAVRVLRARARRGGRGGVRGRVHRHGRRSRARRRRRCGPGGFVVPLNEFRDRAAPSRRSRADRDSCRAHGRGRPPPARARFSWDEMAARTLARYDAAGEARAVRVLHVGLETTARASGRAQPLPRGARASRSAAIGARCDRRRARARRARAATAPRRGAAPVGGAPMALQASAVDRAVRRRPRPRRRRPALRRDRVRSPRSRRRASPRARRSCTSRAPGPTRVAARGAGRQRRAKRAVERRRLPPRAALRHAVLGVRRDPQRALRRRPVVDRRCSRPASTSSGSPRATATPRAAARHRYRTCRARGAPTRPAHGARRAAPGVGRVRSRGQRRPARGRGRRAPARRSSTRSRGARGRTHRAVRRSREDEELVAVVPRGRPHRRPVRRPRGLRARRARVARRAGPPVLGTDAGGLAEALASPGQGPAVPAGDVDGPRRAAHCVRGDRARRGTAARAAATCARSPRRTAGHGVAAQPRGALRERARGDDRPVRRRARPHRRPVRRRARDRPRASEAVRDACRRCTRSSPRTGPCARGSSARAPRVEVLELARRRAPRATATRVDRLLGLSPGGPRPPATCCALARRLRALRPDVVHTNSLKSALYGGARRAARRASRASGTCATGSSPPSCPRPRRRLVRAAARCCRPWWSRTARRRSRRSASPTGRVVPSPLDPSIVPRCAARGARGPAALHDPRAPRAVEGPAPRHRGLRRRVRRRCGDAARRRCAAVRRGRLRRLPARPRRVRLGVAARVVLRRLRRRRRAGALADTDVVIHASLDPEPFGQVVIEAMGAGCAVVVADAGGPAEIVTDGVDGLLYARRRPSGARRRACDASASDPALRAAARHRGGARRDARTRPAALAPRLLAAWDEARGRGWRARRRALRRG